MNKKLSFNQLKYFHAHTDKTLSFLWQIARHAFWVLIALMLLAIVYGELLVFRYTYLLGIQPTENALTPVTFKEELYKSVILQLQSRENEFKSILPQNYSNPFK